MPVFSSNRFIGGWSMANRHHATIHVDVETLETRVAHRPTGRKVAGTSL
jgi:hypothetical protein